LKCERLVVKLGGSVITVKDKPYTLAADRLERAARTLGSYYRSSEGTIQMIVVHGGGSYGHQAVHEARAKPVLDQVDAARIQLAMHELAGHVAKALIAEGVPASIYPGHSLCDGRGRRCSMTPLIGAVHAGMVPQTYGDALYEEGLSIISGDDLAVQAASALNADCLIFVTGVPGVLDREGRTIPVVTSPDQVPPLATTSVDYTGGMTAKVRKAFSFLRGHENSKVWIVGLEGLEKLLLEGEPAGTLLTRSASEPG